MFLNWLARRLLESSAGRGLVRVEVTRAVRVELVSDGSSLRRAMLRVIRSEAKDVFESERERAREVIELSSEFQRWSRQEQERVLAQTPAPEHLAPADDPLTSPWDRLEDARCATCSDPIVYYKPPTGNWPGYWVHQTPRPYDKHEATYALAHPDDATQVMPPVRPNPFAGLSSEDSE